MQKVQARRLFGKFGVVDENEQYVGFATYSTYTKMVFELYLITYITTSKKTPNVFMLSHCIVLKTR